MTLPHALSHVLSILFSWPSGIVLGTLLGNIGWLPVQYLGLRARLVAHHAAVHVRLDAQDTALAEIKAALGLDLHRHDDSP